MDQELAMCAQVNFENLERAIPMLSRHPYYRIAKAQLDEALGGKTVEESLGPVKDAIASDCDHHETIGPAEGPERCARCGKHEPFDRKSKA